MIYFKRQHYNDYYSNETKDEHVVVLEHTFIRAYSSLAHNGDLFYSGPWTELPEHRSKLPSKQARQLRTQQDIDPASCAPPGDPCAPAPRWQTHSNACSHRGTHCGSSPSGRRARSRRGPGNRHRLRGQGNRRRPRALGTRRRHASRPGRRRCWCSPSPPCHLHANHTHIWYADSIS
jgi:hypothetical protein